MKKLLLFFFLLSISHSFSQNNKEIKALEYAHMEIEIPSKCKAKSKYELLDCNGFSAQWLYVNQEVLKTTSEQLFKQFNKKTISKKKIEVISFGATLKGYLFTYKNKEHWNRMIVYGTVNKQPLILNVASEDELIGFSGLNTFLKKIMKIKT